MCCPVKTLALKQKCLVAADPAEILFQRSRVSLLLKRCHTAEEAHGMVIYDKGQGGRDGGRARRCWPLIHAYT